MPFPDSPRVVYQRNPLDQVICQLRFPPILKIDTQVPFEFQDRIRSDYPLYSEEREIPAEIPSEVLSQLPPGVVQSFPLPATNRVNYRFSSPDEKWAVNLTSSFLALSTKDYDRWEKFQKHMELPFKSLMEVYNPAFITRVGLRYVNVIDRNKLDLKGVGWSELIQPYIAGVLAAPGIETSTIQNTFCTDDIRLTDGESSVRIAHGLATSKITGEVGYLLDCDFYLQKYMEAGDALSKLDSFNQSGRRLFRWCITDRLHESMHPEPI